VPQAERVTDLVHDKVLDGRAEVLLGHGLAGSDGASGEEEGSLQADLLCHAALRPAGLPGQLRREHLAEGLGGAGRHRPLGGDARVRIRAGGDLAVGVLPAAHERGGDENVGVQNLARPRVRLRGADGVAHLVGRRPPHRGVADVLGAPRGIVRRDPGLDRVFVPGGAVGLVPGLDALLHVLAVPVGHRAVHVVHDRLGRLHELAALVGRGVAGRQAPALHVADVGGGRLVSRKVLHRVDEVAHPVVGAASLHFGLRECKQGVPHAHGHGPVVGDGLASDERGGRALIGKRYVDLRVVGKAPGLLHVALPALKGGRGPAKVQAEPVADLGVVRRQEVGHLNQQVSGRVVAADDVEGLDHGVPGVVV